MQKKRPTKEQEEKLREYGLMEDSLYSCMCVTFQPGEPILQEGQPMTFLMIVLTGRAKVCATAYNGKNIVLCYYISEGILGDIELMANKETAASTVIAITEFECLAIPYYRNAFHLKSNVEFLNRVGAELAEKLCRSSGNFAAAALCSGEERLCSYILQTSYNERFDGILSDAACSVGISYRHMFRILNQLCSDGILEKQKSGYRILNRNGLLQKAARIFGEGE